MRLKRLEMALSNRRAFLVVAGVALLGTTGYVAYAWLRGYSGFPLDDAWIHQTYARNLGQSGAWEYVPGAPSAGSTSPLWTVLLAVGYAIGLPYRVWAMVLGALSVAAAAWAAGQLAQGLFRSRLVGWLAGLACAVEWHMLWAGASGMETALFAALCLGVMVQATRIAEGGRAIHWAVWGVLGSLAFLTRPEGLVPFALSGLAVLVVRSADLSAARWRAALGRYGLAALGLLLPALPYLAFNLATSGALFPNTFYAKQAEYREVTLALPWLERFGRVIAVQFVGGQALLLPGILAALAPSIRQRRWLALLPVAWWLIAAAIYATRLPVTYQHGRYQMPGIPVLLVYGVAGTWLLLSKAKRLVPRVAARTVALASAVVFAAFLPIGARTYFADVRIIDSEMVAVAHWLDADTPPDAVIAIHDIGAVGYFTQRRLLDLAGLISPEVIPFIRDERQLEQYARDRGASYLVTFPGWYPQFTAGKEIVFQTDSPWSVQAGGENMAVYRLTLDRR